MKPKIIRTCTVSNSISFVAGMIPDLTKVYDVCVLSSPGEYWNCLDQYGNSVRRIKVAMERHISPLRDVIALMKLIRVFRREKPTMVHSMTPKAGLLSMMAAWVCRVPVRVHTFTGLVFPTATGLTQKILILTDRITCACATHIIPEGEGVKRDLLENSITRKPIKVLGHGSCQGINLDYFRRHSDIITLARLKRIPGIFTFIAIGRVVGDKGINELVESFTRLNKETPNTRLLLVGRFEPDLDPLQQDIKREIMENPAIEAVGQQKDIRPWLLASDCAVLASYREGFPNVVIEAGAMGLSQIVTNINGANEIIKEGINGTIVPSKSCEALYDAMKRMVFDTEWRETMARNAREMISSRYEDKFVRRCLYDFYDEILGDISNK